MVEHWARSARLLTQLGLCPTFYANFVDGQPLLQNSHRNRPLWRS